MGVRLPSYTTECCKAIILLPWCSIVSLITTNQRQNTAFVIFATAAENCRIATGHLNCTHHPFGKTALSDYAKELPGGQTRNKSRAGNVNLLRGNGVTGTLLNMTTILIGSLIGVAVGNRLPKAMQDSIMAGLGLVIVVVGVQNALRTGNILIPLLSLVIGVIIGEALNLDAALKRLGGWLQTQVSRLTPASAVAPDRAAAALAAEQLSITRARFINGFVTASLVFCIGPLAIIGSVQNGINSADIKLLAIKATLDFFASMAFASSLGIGVAFSIGPTLLVQGAFAIIGVLLGQALLASGGTLNSDNIYIRELTATGGLLLLAIALLLLDLKSIRVANFLPALLIAPLLLLLAALLGINVYPL